jgi:hypothetical protein
MSQLSEIRDWVRQQTLIETDDWSNAKVDNTINQGIRELAVRFSWPFLAGSANLDVTDGTAEYTFDTITDFTGTGVKLFKIAAIVDNSRRFRVQEISAADAFNMYGGDMPDAQEAQMFYIWGESIFLVPTPDTTEVSAYTVYYYRSPTELTNDTDSPEWDPRFHMVVADYAIARVWGREEEVGKEQASDERFDEGIERMAQFYLNRGEDYPSIVGGGKTGIYLNQYGDRANLPWLK